MMNLLPATLKIVSSGCLHRHVGWPQHNRQRPQADNSHLSSLQLRVPGINTRFKPVSAAKQGVLS